MPNRLMVEVGAGTVELPLKGTAAQIRAVIHRFLLRRGRGVEGKTEAEIGRMYLREIARVTIDGSMDQQRQDEMNSLQAQLEATILTDNDLIDPEPTGEEL